MMRVHRYVTLLDVCFIWIWVCILNISCCMLWTKWNLCACVQHTCLRQWCCLLAACRLCWSRRWSCRGSAASTTTLSWTMDWTLCPCCWTTPAAGRNPHILYYTRAPLWLINTGFSYTFYNDQVCNEYVHLSPELSCIIHYEAGHVFVCNSSLGNSSRATLSRSSLNTAMKSGSASSPTTAQNWQPAQKTPQSLCGMLTR